MKKILLIEDNQDIRENMAEILELSGYAVLTAADGKEGVATALQTGPDIIICDIMMPVLDGYGVIHMLQKNPGTCNIPFIFLTAKSERGEMRKGMELGADDYITKPFNATELLNAVESRLRKHDSIRNKAITGMQGVRELASDAGNKDILQAFTEDGDMRFYKKRQVIYSEGSNPHLLYYIESGKVKTYKTNDEGKELVTSIHSEGDFFGYLALLEHTVYKETAETLEDCELSVIPKNSFESILYNNPEALKKMVTLLARNISEKEVQLLGLAYNSLRKKVASALLRIAAKYEVSNDSPKAIDISRDNLATLAGTAKESLIRTLSDFKEENLIDIIKGDIIIKAKEKLERLIN
ncbi:MAG TPA: response regulator [Flavipsychrobacter sp.]|nr:response regulator [Flavipsychrobacter sp.]